MNFISNISRSKGDPRIIRSGHSSLGMHDRMARLLGWFSIGLGLAELLAARQLTEAFGMKGKTSLVRSFGAREIASGILTLSTEKKIGLYSRVLGDGVDIAALIKASTSRNPKRGNARIALAMVLGVTLMDILSAQGVTVRHRRNQGRRMEYRDRSGFPGGLRSARGRARDFRMPGDMKSLPATGRSVGSRVPRGRRRAAA